MTREKMKKDEAIAIIRKEYLCVDRDCDIERNCGKCDLMMPSKEPILEAYKMAIKALEQEPCGDAIDRAEAMTEIMMFAGNVKPDEEDIYIKVSDAVQLLRDLPPVNPTKTGHCKDCKWWKDSDGTYCRGVHAESKCPINRKEVYEGNGYCYMFEPQERSDKE